MIHTTTPIQQLQSMTLEQIKLTGMQVLLQHLGAVGMIRFLQQFQTGWGDYTTERYTWLDQDEDVHTLAQKVIAQRSE
jgi:hypothetical protein